jgi:hypothetical protein
LAGAAAVEKASRTRAANAANFAVVISIRTQS